MAGFGSPEWAEMFVPDGSLLESFLRGTCVYFAVLVLFRIVLTRQLGSLGLSDVLLLVLVSEAVSQALTAQTRSIPNGIATVSALLVWNYVMDWAAYKWPWVRRLIQPDPLPLVRDGRPIAENLRRERITEDELLAQLRLNGVADIVSVRSACMEGEGEISVVPMADGGAGEQKPDAQPGTETPGAPDFDATLRHFLEAAHELQRAAAWHDERVAEHRRRVGEAKAALRRFGVQPRALLAKGSPPKPVSVGKTGRHETGSST